MLSGPRALLACGEAVDLLGPVFYPNRRARKIAAYCEAPRQGEACGQMVKDRLRDADKSEP